MNDSLIKKESRFQFSFDDHIVKKEAQRAHNDQGKIEKYLKNKIS